MRSCFFHDMKVAVFLLVAAATKFGQLQTEDCSTRVDDLLDCFQAYVSFHLACLA
jgi:hypothetical protein